MMKEIDADYYGYRDEDDGIIVPQELELEKKGKILLLSILIIDVYSTVIILMYSLSFQNDKF